MFTPKDLLQLASKNITEEQARAQLDCFIKGFPFLEIKSSAAVENGIDCPTEEEQAGYVASWNSYLQKEKRVAKFVPASGAASRMFKDLFAFLSAAYNKPNSDFEKAFFDNLPDFPFYEALNKVCLANEGKTITELKSEERYKDIIANLLEEKGLGYGLLPKGLLLFHRYEKTTRTAMEEHLVEGALYAKGMNNTVSVHFTVSPEHQHLFEKLVKEKRPEYEKEYDVKYNLSFSTQNPATDTIAVDPANAPFRDVKGRLLFRPGGHGALIENLNAMDADVVFVKNIDNVVSDGFKSSTIHFQKVMAGMLVSLQQQMFDYVKLIESGSYSHEQIEEMIHFLQHKLCIRNTETKYLEDAELVLYIKRKLMRPLRVCGMVRNEGEPGGGPFLAVNPDGTSSPQILESSQIDLHNPEAKKAFENSSHFNPVALVCALKDVNGKTYHLPEFVDKNTGFISRKSKDGRELKALELPGLWNGSMSGWNTVFVEMPADTFNPVKTVNDLLKKGHQ